MQQTSRFSNVRVTPDDQTRVRNGFLSSHADRIDAELKACGANMYDLLLPESHELPFIIRPDERIQGILYGKYQHSSVGGLHVGRGALVATTERMLLLDKKPLFVSSLEIPYDRASAISYNHVGFIGNVTLHTKIGDIRVRTFNQECARNLNQAVQNRLYAEVPNQDLSYDHSY